MTNNFCECEQDGHCQRYGRSMHGRLREICAGVNVDLGTAAVFREQWKREAPTTVSEESPTHLLLKTDQAPGDAVAMTAAIYSLHRAHPGKYITSVQSPYPEVFEYNPHVAHNISSSRDVREALKGDYQELCMHYPAIHDSNVRGIHFMQGWCEFLGVALDIHVPLLTNRPHLYFDHHNVALEDYWVVCSGGKRDFTNKLWGHKRYQEVVRRLLSRVRFVQVGGGKPSVPWNEYTRGSQEDSHQPLVGALNLIGKTDLRRLFDIVRVAKGVLCGVSLLMHVAAALERPCVVIAGGREPVQWNAYPRQHYLHTCGMLPCRSPQGHEGGGCWRSRTVPLGDGTALDREPCQRVVDMEPECMTMIKPKMVAELISQHRS